MVFIPSNSRIKTRSPIYSKNMPAATTAMAETTPLTPTLKLLAPLVAVLDAWADVEEAEEAEDAAALAPVQGSIDYFQDKVQVHILFFSALAAALDEAIALQALTRVVLVVMVWSFVAAVDALASRAAILVALFLALSARAVSLLARVTSF